ncbi:MAG: hypothetical protein M1835_004463 [Candelina submexicana]|nr:MAG: hypothetical protein M1835_004463 [Candelina submexicana]
MGSTYPVTQSEATSNIDHSLQMDLPVSRRATSKSQTPCRPELNLLLLPGEVLNSIYRHLLCRYVIRLQSPNVFNPYPSRRSPGAHGPHLDILRVCRKTYNDALSLLYGENTLFYAYYTVSLHPFDLLFPPQYLPLVKRIHILVYSYSNWNEDKTDHEAVAGMLQHFSVPGVGLECMKIDLILKGEEREDGRSRRAHAPRPPKDQIILTRSPFAKALLNLTTVKRIVIELGGRANFAKPLFERLKLGLKSKKGLPERVIEIWDNRNIRMGPGPIYTFEG